MTFAWFKGHGTVNDFVLLPDHDGTLHGALDPAFVAALCDRRRGIGADGVMRVVRSASLGVDSPAEWFMDYRNADGSVSEMCGNGVRVFARHLLQEGLVEGPRFEVATRDGLKVLQVEGDEIAVEMGAWTTGSHTKVEVDDRAWEALEVHTGNPHAVAFVDDVADAGPLAVAPAVDAGVFPEGVNVEFVQRVAERHVAMRVHERGSGETRSCGTGACATAIAAARADGVTEGTYRVDVPGGTLHITVSPDRTVLTGPAVIVAGGTMEWYA